MLMPRRHWTPDKFSLTGTLVRNVIGSCYTFENDGYDIYCRDGRKSEIDRLLTPVVLLIQPPARCKNNIHLPNAVVTCEIKLFGNNS